MKLREAAPALALGFVLILVIQHFTWTGPGGSLLFTLTFWASLIQGAIALVAVCELTSARWIAQVRAPLLRLRPLLLLFALLFPALSSHLSIYPWVQHPTFWLRGDFFILRNSLLLLLCWLAAEPLAKRCRNRDASASSYAILYLFVFVTTQSFVAFDWVMTLDYPWRSTLFGLYFAIEALLCALFLSAVLFFFAQERKSDRISLPDARRDLATLIFGFCVLWAGLFFAQLLVLWYGNLPEERGYLYLRGWTQPWRNRSMLFLGGIFLLPFFTLLSKRAKEIPGIVLGVGLVGLCAVALERLILIAPETAVSPAAVLLQSLLLLALTTYFAAGESAKSSKTSG